LQTEEGKALLRLVLQTANVIADEKEVIADEQEDSKVTIYSHILSQKN
jgi:hypothetical protein